MRRITKVREVYYLVTTLDHGLGRERNPLSYPDSFKIGPVEEMIDQIQCTILKWQFMFRVRKVSLWFVTLSRRSHCQHLIVDLSRVGHMFDEVQSVVATVLLSPEPDDDTFCLRIDLAHGSYLMIFLIKRVLVDTQSIYPDRSGVRTVS